MPEGQTIDREFFTDCIQPIFQPLIANLVIKRPEDITAFAIKYFQNLNKPIQDQSDDDDNPDRFEQISEEQFEIRKTIKRQTTIRKMRMGVSSEANSLFNAQRKTISVRTVGIKDEKTQIMIRFSFMHSFLFQDFTVSDARFLINSMIMERTQPGDVVIRQGEFGDCMYFVEEGLFECSIADRESRKGETRVLKNYQAGQTFGQLCLLHSAKRQATVICKLQGVLYSLSRQTYTHIRKMSIVRRRELYIRKLRMVNILSSLHNEELQKLCDLVTQSAYDVNEYVIHQGDMGSRFFIVLEGLLVAKSSDQTIYQYYKEGDYFGELALIKKKPRQVSVLTVTKCRLISLTSSVFLSIINHDKAYLEINHKYKNAKPRTVPRRKKNPVDSSAN